MIKIIVTDERELPDVMARHDFASLFSHPYRIFLQEPNGHLRSLGGGGITNTVVHAGPVTPATAGGGAGGTGTTTVKRRKAKGKT